MKFDPNCVRKILLELEKQPFGSSLSIQSLSSSIEDYQEDEIAYCCLKLAEANYIDISTANVIGPLAPGIKSVNDITFYGHEFLNNIRDDGIWKNVKSIGSKIGSTSISALSQIASNVITELIRHQFGI